MKISWVFAADYVMPVEVDQEAIKQIGPSWGSWQTWRSCATDNVICHDRAQAERLLTNGFQRRCNFYLPRTWYKELGRPTRVNLYEGSHDIQLDNIEDTVAMQFAAANCDLILLMGFDFALPESVEDRFQRHKLQNRHGIMHQTIRNAQDTQWVLVDHPHKVDRAYESLSNLTCDTLTNVLKLLG